MGADRGRQADFAGSGVVSARFTWRAIPNCPGRMVLASGPTDITLRDVVGPNVAIEEFRVPAARDAVLVARLDAGGLISYRRADGSYIHTLNSADGFARKLAQLGITTSDGRRIDNRESGAAGQRETGTGPGAAGADAAQRLPPV